MEYTAQAFSKHLHKTFTLRRPEGSTMVLELAEVKSIRSTPQNEQFSLVFQGPASPHLEQRMYSIGSQGTGDLDLFIVPVGKNEKGIVYEVVFNQLGQRG